MHFGDINFKVPEPEYPTPTLPLFLQQIDMFKEVTLLLSVHSKIAQALLAAS